MRTSRGLLGWMLGLPVALACGSADGPQALDEAAAPGSASNSGSASASGSASGSSSGEPPLVAPPTGSALADGSPVLAGGACTGKVAAQTFAAALCSCEDTNIAGYLKTRQLAPAGSTTADSLEQLGGSVGVNRNYITEGYADIGGSFTVAGPRDILFGGLLKAGQDLQLNPAADVAGVVEVGRDAWLAEQMRAFGRVAITRDLYTDAGGGFRGIALVDVGGATRTQSVVIASPCACGQGDLIDVAALVDDARTKNDDDAIGLDPDAVDLAVGLGTALTLPGGRYYVHQVGTLGGVQLRITGKTALFVAGDLIATGAFRVQLDADAELDLFIEGNLALTGAALFGDRARPAATRVYVGGGSDVTVAGYGAFVGNLYAPAANIFIGGYGQIYGSLFGKNINAAGFLSVGYDQGIQQTGDGCPPSSADVPRIR
jgi:hypothetical protein